MPAQLLSTGLQINTFDERLAEIQALLRATFGTNANLTSRSVLGMLARIWAENDVEQQEVLQDVYKSFDPREAFDASLERMGTLSGARKLPASKSVVTGQARFNGTPATNIPNGKRVRLEATQTVWVVTGGPYVIGGGGTVLGTVEAELTGPTIALATGTAGWTILDAVAGWASFETLADATVGRNIETDKEFRQRRESTIFAASTETLEAVRAAVALVSGVTLVRVYENVGFATDSDGIVGKAINVLVEGGLDADIAAAIFSRRSAGCETHGSVVTNITNSQGQSRPIRHDRTTLVNMWLRATLTTSTSEEVYPSDGDNAVKTALLDYGNENNQVGADVLPFKFIGAIEDAGVPGIDLVTLETSLDGAAWGVTKRSIGIRQRASFDSTRISVVKV